MSPRRWILAPVVEEDLPEIVAIERSSFPNPWPEEAFRPDPDATWARVLVLRERGGPGEVSGYICYWMLEGEMEIQNVAVRVSDRRTGGANFMLTEAMGEAGRNGCRTAWLEVRPSNKAALALYESLGFQVAGRRGGYYADGEDALIMRAELPLGSSPAKGRKLRRSLKGPRTGW